MSKKFYMFFSYGIEKFWVWLRRRLIFQKIKTANYRQLRIFGIKFRIYRTGKYRKWVIKSFMQKLVRCKNVPLVYKDNFYYYNWFPVNSSSFTRESIPSELPKVGIVLQGPIIIENDFTLETIKNYKRIFNGKNVEMIVSTWLGEDKKALEAMRNLGVRTVQSDQIDNRGRGNVNLQIISSREGIKAARKYGCKYILKTRADQRFYATEILDFLFNLQKTFLLTDKPPLHSRLIACSFNTFKYRLYGVSDMFLFGHIDDVEKYWNIPFDNADSGEWANETQFSEFQKWCPETYIVEKFLENIGHLPKGTLSDSYKILADYFTVVDKEQIEMFWPKYSNKDRRWNFFYPNAMEELKFKDWLLLYYNGGRMPEWENKVWSGQMPNFS